VVLVVALLLRPLLKYRVMMMMMMMTMSYKLLVDILPDLQLGYSWGQL